VTRLSDELRQSLESASLRYHEALAGAWPARSYLLGRGINDSTASAFRLGVADGSIPEHAAYQGRVSIPYLTKLGGTVSIKFRAAGEGSPKYLSPYPTRIYNPLALDKGEQEGYVAICEGEFDAIVLDGLCGIPAVGIPGVETWVAHPEWPELFRGFSKVLVFPDTDPEGQGMKLASRILSALDVASIVSLPAKDVNDSYLDIGRNGIRKLAGL
jgi:DNA primase